MELNDSAIRPSQFMRQLRPELYSDSTSRPQYCLSAEVLSHHLSTLTERNETHDFELFCRKLCERTICPYLRPATGPEGGGDSKADTETTPVAEEISKLTYIGVANNSSERWAFAFSAKKRWAEKVKSDVAGIVGTSRGYKRIFFVTSRAARAKDRARIEDELSGLYNIPVTILDKSWIIEEVIGKDRRDLAFLYLRIGTESSDRDLGPSDYTRSKQLAEIERELADPAAFDGMAVHRAAEALVAAKLARSLELPRTDVEGRFQRAIRLADEAGTYRQQLAARYEALWTAFWWFDDFQAILLGYEGFESLVIDDSQASNLELLCNLAQLLFNSVISGQATAERIQLDPRVERLSSRLARLSEDAERPNNALEARVSFLTIQVNWALLRSDPEGLAGLWPQFAEVLVRAEGLGEFDASRLSQLIERFGQVAGDNLGYRDLVDQLSEFTSKRTGEGEGALVLLRRAKQLSLDQNMELIRLLGRAARLLTKREHAQEQVGALAELAVAYKSAGLSWAARASATSAAATMFIDAEDGSALSIRLFPVLMNVAWMALSLNYLPEVLDAIQVARGCLEAFPHDDASGQRATEQLESLDLLLACQLVNLSDEEVGELNSVPDVLRGLALHHSWSALMYRLGYEDQLRAEGWIPESESPQAVASLFAQMAGRSAAESHWRPMVVNAGSIQVFRTSVLGVRIDITHAPTDTSIIVAEAIAGAVEAFSATAFELEAMGHVERFEVRILEADVSSFLIENDLDQMRIVVRCPAGNFPGSAGLYSDFQRMLLEIATTIFLATSLTRNREDATMQLLKGDAAGERLAMIASLCLSRSRIFGGVARLSRWDKHSPGQYGLRVDRPVVIPQAPSVPTQRSAMEDSGDAPRKLTDHLKVQVRSVIDMHLWDQAVWSGAAYGSLGASAPPFLALMFKEEEAATKIFERWRHRFGERDDAEEIYIGIIRQCSTANPAHYGMLLTSRPREVDERAELSTVVSRSLTIEPADDTNLCGFLTAYEHFGAYLLMPMVLPPGEAQPRLLTHLALFKRSLSVKAASDVRSFDPELAFLKPRGLVQPSNEANLDG